MRNPNNRALIARVFLLDEFQTNGSEFEQLI